LLGNDGAKASDEVETAVSPTSLAIAAASTETATATPTETATATLTVTATATDTAVPTNTLSPTATTTPSTTPLPENMAVVNENASLFSQPDAEASEINVVMAEDMVTVLGRSANNSWLYIRDEAGNVGFVFAELLIWSGDIASLPIRIGTIVPNSTATPILSQNLSLDIYQLDGTEACNGSAWTQMVYMRAQGVSGTFDYYWEGKLVGTAVNDNITFEVSSSGGAIVGTGSVIVNGTTTSQELFIPAPACSDE